MATRVSHINVGYEAFLHLVEKGLAYEVKSGLFYGLNRKVKLRCNGIEFGEGIITKIWVIYRKKPDKLANVVSKDYLPYVRKRFNKLQNHTKSVIEIKLTEKKNSMVNALKSDLKAVKTSQ